jgi:4'-phosphopantetheinyl transferase
MDTALFRSNAEHINLNKHCLHVYSGNIEDYINEVENYFFLLDDEEKKRALLYKFEKDKILFVVSHGVLRNILSAYTGISAGAILFSKNKFGKPFVQNHTIEFNLSHSGKYFAIAVSCINSVGIDVEEINTQFDFSEIVKQHFSINEKAQIESSGNSQQTFFMLWTQKEAYLKMKGVGLNEKEDLNERQKTVQIQTKVFKRIALSVCSHPDNTVDFFKI